MISSGFPAATATAARVFMGRILLMRFWAPNFQESWRRATLPKPRQHGLFAAGLAVRPVLARRVYLCCHKLAHFARGPATARIDHRNVITYVLSGTDGKGAFRLIASLFQRGP